MEGDEKIHQKKSPVDAKIKKINRIVEVAPILALVLILFIVLAQIISRYIYPLPWTLEVARFCHIWLIFIGAYLVATTSNGHVKISFVADRLPDRWQLWLKLFTYLLCVFCLLVISFSAVRGIISLFTIKTPAAQIPLPFVFASLLMGSSFMLIYFGFRAVEILRDMITRKKETRKKI